MPRLLILSESSNTASRLPWQESNWFLQASQVILRVERGGHPNSIGLDIHQMGVGESASIERDHRFPKQLGNLRIHTRWNNVELTVLWRITVFTLGFVLATSRPK